MRVVCDIEANGLKPDKIWLICCRDIDSNSVYKFYPDRDGYSSFTEFAKTVTLWVGHYLLNYDAPAIQSVIKWSIPYELTVDTLVLSKLLEGNRQEHSLESWGVTFGVTKKGLDIKDWSCLTQEMEDRCLSDTEINKLLFLRFEKYLSSPVWKQAIETEHYIAFLCNTLNTNGFAFDYSKAISLKEVIDKELEELIKELKEVFLPKVVPLKEVTPKGTSFGTIHRGAFKFLGPNPDLSCYTIGAPFTRIKYEPFNPRSHKQRLERLWEAGWKPTEKTKTHKEAEKALRALNRKGRRGSSRKEEIDALRASLGEYGVSGYGWSGWKTNEENLKTLPDTAPEAAQKLVRFMLLASRSSIIQTWLDAYDSTTGRIHGSFNGIGAWTQRMSHDRPNMGNIPKYDSKQPHKTPYSDQMRALWCSAPDRLLIGVDAESIQLRILGHYINDKELTEALISGDKSIGTDPHSVNQRALGPVCRSRDDAKTLSKIDVYKLIELRETPERSTLI